MISITKGDITKFSVDAIVNAANSSLLGGGGVAKKRNESYTLEKWYLYQISKIKGSGWKNCCCSCSSSGYRKTGKSSFY